MTWAYRISLLTNPLQLILSCTIRFVFSDIFRICFKSSVVQEKEGYGDISAKSRFKCLIISNPNELYISSEIVLFMIY